MWQLHVSKWPRRSGAAQVRGAHLVTGVAGHKAAFVLVLAHRVLGKLRVHFERTDEVLVSSISVHRLYATDVKGAA